MFSLFGPRLPLRSAACPRAGSDSRFGAAEHPRCPQAADHPAPESGHPWPGDNLSSFRPPTPPTPRDPGRDQDAPTSSPRPLLHPRKAIPTTEPPPDPARCRRRAPRPSPLPSVTVNFVEIPFTVKDRKNQLVPGPHLAATSVSTKTTSASRFACSRSIPFPLSVALVIDQSVTTPDAMAKINNSLDALQGAFTPPMTKSPSSPTTTAPRCRPTLTAAQSARPQRRSRSAPKATGPRSQCTTPPARPSRRTSNVNNNANSYIDPKHPTPATAPA